MLPGIRPFGEAGLQKECACMTGGGYKNEDSVAMAAVAKI
ncbi:hypothetical protein HMPREF0294_0316 [Corynebacterium glucuronolyticum ATCC 51867]|uniref:Uncharacterized protein n=1 Tax=Corynebacterium glucuronolyticum ATCC 51866 TaxID=548478 RepID=A0ABM9XR05_9CORY|nr:hypothetical protein HMPREF0294_0316 [Corynebacterium glucuronolyticum ATCC 51867]EEI63606.1 hypothetical protein HMPREF0293_0985 [Corynebacterium glucuronolyticum ATCC 51866]